MKQKILIVDDDFAVRSSLELLFKSNGFMVDSASKPMTALDLLKRQNFNLAILDMNFTRDTSGCEGLTLLSKVKILCPNLPVILLTAWGSISLAVEGMKRGAANFVTKPWDNHHLLQDVQTALDLQISATPGSQEREALDKLYDFAEIVGCDPKLLKVLETVGRVSKTDASILILGESGTGKELLAEAIHNNSPREKKPFVKVNLGGISSTLFESEMFGHKRGSFTDAHHDRIGRFELANNGSIFLDEIGELDLSSQVKLLRVLQDRTFEVLGSSISKQLNLRVIAATNRELPELVKQNQFREDLFYRINLITVRIPPLRERRDDIPLLVNSFLNNFRLQYNRPEINISRAAMNWLKDLPFPGNVRELRNLLERVVLISPHDNLEIKDFQAHQGDNRQTKSVSELPEVGSMTMEELEISMINKALKHHNNNISKVAKSLGFSRAALYRRMEKYRISYED